MSNRGAPKEDNKFPELTTEGEYPEELPPILSSDDEDDLDLSPKDELILKDAQVDKYYKDAMQEIVDEFKDVFSGPLGKIKFGS